MTRAGSPRALAYAAAAVAWFGVALQLGLSLRLAVANGKSVLSGLVVYFGYFTILTNILVALVLTVPRASATSAAGRLLSGAGVRTATAAAIALVSIAYHLLLRRVWDPQGAQLLADVVLHYVTPALYLLDWWFGVPKDGLRLRHVAAWTTYPVAYLVYMLVRGAATGLYPYPFLDAGALGLARVLVNGFGLLAVFLVIALALLVAARVQTVRGRSKP